MPPVPTGPHMLKRLLFAAAHLDQSRSPCLAIGWMSRTSFGSEPLQYSDRWLCCLCSITASIAASPWAGCQPREPLHASSSSSISGLLSLCGPCRGGRADAAIADAAADMCLHLHHLRVLRQLLPVQVQPPFLHACFDRCHARCRLHCSPTSRAITWACEHDTYVTGS